MEETQYNKTLVLKYIVDGVEKQLLYDFISQGKENVTIDDLLKEHPETIIHVLKGALFLISDKQFEPSLTIRDNASKQ